MRIPNKTASSTGEHFCDITRKPGRSYAGNITIKLQQASFDRIDQNSSNVH